MTDDDPDDPIQLVPQTTRALTSKGKISSDYKDSFGRIYSQLRYFFPKACQVVSKLVAQLYDLSFLIGFLY